VIRPYLLVAALLLVATPTFAENSGAPSPTETPLRVVLVTNHADARIMPLLKAELESLGIEVVLVDHGENEVIPRDLSEAARKTHALAGFRVIVAKKSVEVWIADRVTGKIVLREALEQDTSSKGSESVVVLRAVELLRVSLMELEAPHAPRGDAKPPKEIEKLAGFPAQKAIHAIEVGAFGSWYSSDLGALPGLHLGYRYRISNWIHAGLTVQRTLSTSEVESNDGSATAELTAGQAFIGLHYPEATALLQPAVRLGAGVLFTRIVGNTSGTLDEFSHNVFSPSLLVHARLNIRLSSAFRLWLAAEATPVFARPAIDMAEERAASFSPVFVSGLGGMQIAWP